MDPLTQEEVEKIIQEYYNMTPEERENICPFKDVEIGDVDFKGFKFKGDINFSGAKFVKSANFGEAKFAGKAYFTNAQFTEDANFNGAHFSEGAIFTRVKFAKEANFIGTRFNEEVHFSGAQFINKANFWKAYFARRAFFVNIHFTEIANFNEVQFSEDAHFEKASFNGGASFIMARFVGGVNFFNARFTGEATFYKTQFSKNNNFVYTQFSETAQFMEANFGGNISFSRARFNEKADFWETLFRREANFESTHFTEDSNFGKAQFNGETYFNYTEFKKNVTFIETRFSGNIYFSLAQFGEEAYFGEAKFLGETTFRGSDEGKREPDKYFFKQRANFSNITLDPEKLFFKKVNLSKCSFLDTDLRKIEFTDVQWDKQPVFPNISKRNALYDERKTDSSFYPLVENLYQQLKLNYEEKGNYPEAGDFYYGEMEIKRKQLPNWIKRNILSFISWYKYLSGYGEKYVLAFSWLLIILFVFSIFYLFSGLKPLIVGESFNWDISFNIAKLKGMFTKEFIRNILDSLIYSFQTMTLQRTKYIEPIGRFSIILHVIQSIIGPLQIALFALALRRRFKR